MKAKTITMIEAFAMSWILALAACGGGGGNGGDAPAPPAPSAEGLWIGSTSTSRSVTGIVLDNGTYWVLYSFPNFSISTAIAGVVQGTGTSLNGNFSSSNGIDFNPEEQGINDATVSASYTAKQGFNGSVTYPSLNQAFTFTSLYDTDYDQAPSVSAIEGTYAGIASVAGGTEPTTIVVSSQGIVGVVLGTGFTGLIPNGCRYVGFAVPRAKGNLYDLSIDVSGGGACSNGPRTVTGIAYFDSRAKRLYVAALDNSRSNGLIFAGRQL